VPDQGIKFGADTYRDGARERIDEARVLFKAEHYAMCMYVAGLAVEGMLRALCALRDDYFDEKHDLRKFAARLESLGLLRSAERDHDFVARVQEVAQIWRNTLRFSGRKQLEQLLVILGVLTWKKMDRGLKPRCDEYVEDCLEVVQRCEVLWQRQRSRSRD
jgi:hypothetical protein